MLHKGDQVERYTVEAIIGTGGTSVVYRVLHAQLGTRHALKVLSVSSDIIRRRMLTEGQVQAKLSHPNVVGVTDVLELEDGPALVMEYIEGPTLDKAMTKYRITLEAAENLFLGVAAGTAEAHRAGLVHRDLKPANVMLARTEEGFVPKVTDFGLAKVLAYDEATTGHTRAGVALGTPAYMAPEQVRDAATVDQRADVFAMGCILYELVTHRRVFPGDDTIEVYNSILDGQYVPPKHLVPDLPDRIDTAIQGALIVDRDQRIPDMLTMIRVMMGEEDFHIPEVFRPRDEIRLTLDELEHAGDSGPDLRVVATHTDVTQSDDAPRFDPLLHSIVDPEMQRGALPSGHRPRLATDTLATEEVIAPAPRSRFFFFGAALGLFMGTLLAAVVGTWFALDLFETTPTTPTALVVPAPEPEPEPVPEPEPEPVPEVAPAPAPAPAPVAPATHTVKLLSSPPTATLTVDGQAQGRTPAKLQLKAGVHTVEVRSGATSARFQIDVAPNDDNKWCYAFAQQKPVLGSCP